MEYTPVDNDRFLCRFCRKPKDIEYKEIDDVYEDYRYHCKKCDKTWVVEGSDY